MAGEIDLRAVRRAHLVGIGGSGMSGLAHLLLQRGIAVAGSDARGGPALDRLAALGARVHVGHVATQLDAPDLVIVSAAVAPDNPEIAAARARGLPLRTHAQVLGLLMRGARGIGVAGTHGKTTTTALTGFLLERGGADPTILAGAEMLNYDASVRLGGGAAVVVEADEYDRRFLSLWPHSAAITSVEPDHLDYFRDLAEIESVFAQFAARLPADGLLVACAADAGARRVPSAARRLLYGMDADADWCAVELSPLPSGGTAFQVVGPRGQRAAVRLPLVGRHNVLNALAALALVEAEGVPLESAAAALADFRGTRRRFERVGAARGVMIVDDYAHHPTAVAATLAAARSSHVGPLWVAFQPHTRHRTAALLDEFAQALGVADRALLVPIYEPVGREQERIDIEAADLAARIPGAQTAESLEAAAEWLAAMLPPGALLVTMGAGDVDRLGRLLLARLEAR